MFREHEPCAVTFGRRGARMPRSNALHGGRLLRSMRAAAEARRGAAGVAGGLHLHVAVSVRAGAGIRARHGRCDAAANGMAERLSGQRTSAAGRRHRTGRTRSEAAGVAVRVGRSLGAGPDIGGAAAGAVSLLGRGLLDHGGNRDHEPGGSDDATKCFHAMFLHSRVRLELADPEARPDERPGADLGPRSVDAVLAHDVFFLRRKGRDLVVDAAFAGYARTG